MAVIDHHHDGRDARLARPFVASVGMRRPGTADLVAFEKPAKHASRGSAQSLSKAPFYSITVPLRAWQGHTYSSTLAGSMIASSIGPQLPQTRDLIAQRYPRQNLIETFSDTHVLRRCRYKTCSVAMRYVICTDRDLSRVATHCRLSRFLSNDAPGVT